MYEKLTKCPNFTRCLPVFSSNFWRREGGNAPSRRLLRLWYCCRPKLLSMPSMQAVVCFYGRKHDRRLSRSLKVIHVGANRQIVRDSIYTGQLIVTFALSSSVFTARRYVPNFPAFSWVLSLARGKSCLSRGCPWLYALWIVCCCCVAAVVLGTGDIKICGA